METATAIDVPARLSASYSSGFGEEGRAWIAGLPTLAADFLDRWELRRDGAPMSGEASLVLPVLRRDGTPAVLKLQLPRAEFTGAIIGLRTWDGAGTVRLLDHDPGTTTMLLERLDTTRSLAALENDDEATTILAGLLARLVSTPAPDGLPRLADVATDMLERVPAAAGTVARHRSRTARGGLLQNELWDIEDGGSALASASVALAQALRAR